MAFGIENRSPLLDHRLFEHVATLPPSRRVGALATKPLLRRMARGRIPAAALAQPKTGFNLPLAEWLRGPLAPWAASLLRDPQGISGALRGDAVRARWEAFRGGGADGLAPLRLWGLAALEFWARRFGVETRG
jgi:asparagine synthase (glutamine-hydrolysing)